MSTNADHLQELLNGLLDGVLTDEEQRTLDLAMKSDPSLEAKLSELQAMRRSLLRGRSVGRLGPDFSKGIVAAARQRAESLGDEAPEWLRPSNRPAANRPAADRVSQGSRSMANSRSEQSLETEQRGDAFTVPTSVSRRAWRVWIPMLAAATAASMLLYVAGPFSSRPTVQPLIGERIPNQASEMGADRTGLEGDDQDANKMAVDLLADGVRLPTKTEQQVTPNVGADNPVTESSRESPGNSRIAEVKLPEMKEEISRAPESRIADSGKMDPKGDAASNVVNNSDKMSDPIRDILNASGVSKPIYTMVVDIAVDPVAEQNDALRTLLEEHEIVYADDLNMSSEQLDSLVSSQMIGKMSGIDTAKGSDDVQVMFIRAKAKRIDSFLMEIAGQYKDFPKFRMDMSFDPSVSQLMDQLSTIANEEEGARRLTFRGSGDSGLVSAFPAASKRGDFLDVEKRKLLAGPSGDRKRVSSREETSYLILLVRSASPDR